MNILGINAYHGNASAAIVCDGRLIAAVEEERFNRVKYAAGFPAQAIRYCLKEAGLTLADIDHVAVPRNPYARLATKLFYALRMPSFARERAKVLAKFTGIPEALALAFDVDPKKIAAKFHRIEHHQAHLASSFFVSPFERAEH
jgi:carbamoyltransferase